VAVNAGLCAFVPDQKWQILGKQFLMAILCNPASSDIADDSLRYQSDFVVKNSAAYSIDDDRMTLHREPLIEGVEISLLWPK
jgi:hypothetical protein